MSELTIHLAVQAKLDAARAMREYEAERVKAEARFVDQQHLTIDGTCEEIAP
jgi:hypothetical protein